MVEAWVQPRGVRQGVMNEETSTPREVNSATWDEMGTVSAINEGVESAGASVRG